MIVVGRSTMIGRSMSMRSIKGAGGAGGHQKDEDQQEQE